MSYLKRFDFNKTSGWVSVAFVSIAISLLIFAGVYLNEGFSWLLSFKTEQVASYENIGNNWIRGAVIAGVAALLLFVLSFIMLGNNKKNTSSAKPLFNRLDINKFTGLLSIVFFSVSFVFFLNAALYRIEVVKWFYAGIEFAEGWYFAEAASWVTAATTMAIIGAVLSAAGWLMIVLTWKKPNH